MQTGRLWERRCIAIRAPTNIIRMGFASGASGSARPLASEEYPVATLVLTVDGVVAALNDLAARLLSRGRDEILGQPFSALLTRPSARRFEDHIARSKEGPLPISCEVELARPSGRATHILLHIELLGGNDADAAYRIVAIDVSSYVRSIRRAEKARTSAERVARSRAEFLARLSHEIRSALASMIGFADILKETLPAEEGELTGIIRDSGKHLLDTLNSVMDLARLELENGEVEVTEVDVVDRMRQRSNLLERFAVARHLDFAFHAESPRAVALLNETFLDRVIHNLVDNAIKYTPRGKVELSVEERDGQVWIYVADTGMGIRREFLPRLFNPFEREKRPEGAEAEGVGLGLAITKYLVELMGGRITVCSTVGTGSTFTVNFPALSPGSETATSGQESPISG